MSRRGLTISAAAAAAGGVGYYLYSAGGDPKVAQKKFQADAAEAQAKIKSDLPGKEKEYEKRGEAMATQAGQKFDKAVGDARTKLTEAEAKAKEYKNEAGREMSQAVDKFDTTVEKKASEAKSGISSWVGLGGK